MKKEITVLLCATLLAACGTSDPSAFSGRNGEVKLIALHPADEQIAQVQAYMHPQIDRTVHVFAPEGRALKSYLAQIDAFNTRSDSATSWNEVVSSEGDFLVRMLAQPPGNVALLSGNTAAMNDYAGSCIDAGINVLSSTPLATATPGFRQLERSLGIADEKSLVLYELMPERYETAAALQRALTRIPEFYGIQLCGTADAPAILSESILPLSPGADSLTLANTFFTAAAPRIDLIQLAIVGQERIKYNKQIQFNAAQRHPVALSVADYRKLTGTEEFPANLQPFVSADTLRLPVDGSVRYVFNGVNTLFSIRHSLGAGKASPAQGNPRAKGRISQTNTSKKEAAFPSAAGVTGIGERLTLQGSDAVLTLVQSGDSLPQLYVFPASGIAPEKFTQSLHAALQQLDDSFPGLSLEPVSGNGFRVVIPVEKRLSKAECTARATEQYLSYLVQGYPPFWEVDHMLAKYYTLTRPFDPAQ